MRSTRSGISDIIAKELRQDIITGRRTAGTPLRQDQLAEEFKASHVPVREAPQALQSEGPVRYLPRKGASVAPLSVNDVLDLTELRMELEGLALKRAMQERSGIDINKAEEILKSSNLSARLDEWVAANWAFHRTLYRPCGRPRLLSTLEELWLHSERYMRTAWEKLDYQEKSQAEHQELVSLIGRHDPPRAVRLLKKHIKQAGMGLIKILPDLNIS